MHAEDLAGVLNLVLDDATAVCVAAAWNHRRSLVEKRRRQAGAVVYDNLAAALPGGRFRTEVLTADEVEVVASYVDRSALWLTFRHDLRRWRCVGDENSNAHTALDLLREEMNRVGRRSVEYVLDMVSAAMVGLGCVTLFFFSGTLLALGLLAAIAGLLLHGAKRVVDIRHRQRGGALGVGLPPWAGWNYRLGWTVTDTKTTIIQFVAPSLSGIVVGVILTILLKR
jgi:hypothetical protein